MGHRRLNVAIIVVTALVMIGISVLGIDVSSVRLVLSLPLVLVMPGYALSLAFFPGDKLELAERIALSLGTSLAITALSSLLLHWSAWGLTAQAWAVMLGSITLIASGAAMWQELAPERMSARIPPPPFIPVYLRLTFDQVLLFSLAGAVALGAIVVALWGETTQDNPAFTQLWLLPGEDLATVQLGVESYEPQTTTYRLELDADGKIIFDEPLITLELGARWTSTITLPDVTAYAITARLFREYVPEEECQDDTQPELCQRNTEVYRRAVLWSWTRIRAVNQAN